MAIPEGSDQVQKTIGATAGLKMIRKNGAGDGDRTRDIQLGKLAFYR